MAEKRRYKRVQYSVDVIHKVMGVKGERRDFSIDVSGGGLRIPLAEKLSKGTLLELGIVLPGQETLFFALAEVVWQSAQPIAPDKKDIAKKWIGKYETGVKFLRMDVPSRKEVIRFVHRMEKKEK